MMKSPDSFPVARMTPLGLAPTSMNPAARRSRAASRAAHPLSSLRNVGPATCADFDLLGITSLAQLARSDPDVLFKRLERITGKRQDPCVWDVFAAAIFEAKTGKARAWWTFTPIRKAREERRDRKNASAER